MRTVTATRYVTALREGGSLPGLVEGDDDGLYVVKFHGAGQGPRALVAEWVGGELARRLGLTVPELVGVDARPGARRRRAAPGDPGPGPRQRRAQPRPGLPARGADVQPGRHDLARGHGSRDRRGHRLARRPDHQPRPDRPEPEPAGLARPDAGSSTTGRRSTSTTRGASPRRMPGGRSSGWPTTSCCRSRARWSRRTRGWRACSTREVIGAIVADIPDAWLPAGSGRRRRRRPAPALRRVPDAAARGAASVPRGGRACPRRRVTSSSTR